ncbi:MAG: hypothetical protein AAF290_11770 [Pseudomonadota bacterium]
MANRVRLVTLLTILTTVLLTGCPRKERVGEELFIFDIETSTAKKHCGGRVIVHPIESKKFGSQQAYEIAIFERISAGTAKERQTEDSPQGEQKETPPQNPLLAGAICEAPKKISKADPYWRCKAVSTVDGKTKTEILSVSPSHSGYCRKEKFVNLVNACDDTARNEHEPVDSAESKVPVGESGAPIDICFNVKHVGQIIVQSPPDPGSGTGGHGTGH